MGLEDQQTLDTASLAYAKSDSAGARMQRAFPICFAWSTTEAVADSTTGVHAAIADTGVTQTIITAITSPVAPRNITCTTTGTATDVKAISVTIYGTNYNDERISEAIGPFTVNTNHTVSGSKAFKTVDRISLPAHDGTGCSTSVGWGSKLGLPIKLTRNTHVMTFINNVVEGTPPTLAKSTSAIESNTLLLNSSLAGTAVQSYFLLP